MLTSIRDQVVMEVYIILPYVITAAGHSVEVPHLLTGFGFEQPCLPARDRLCARKVDVNVAKNAG